MKRIIIIAAAVLAALFVFSQKSLFVSPRSVPTETITTAVPSVSVSIDNGQTIATESGIHALNAYQALTEAAKKKNLELKTKQYDFGVFVEEIGTFANTKEKSWIYFVNGKSGTVAADKQSLHAGDTVEWKYTTPTIE